MSAGGPGADVPSIAGRPTRRRWPILVAAAITAAATLPFVWLASQNPDEDQYAWSAGYYGQKVLDGDFERRGADRFTDPGFDPDTYWGRSMGTRWVYALGLATPWASAPANPYSYVEPSLQGTSTRLDEDSRVFLRLLGAVCAVVGAALIALRFGWVGVGAVAVVLAMPHGAENFARAWAEGPMLLAFGLAAAAWGHRSFPFVVGVASTVKLTAVGLWPLVLVRRAHHWRSRLAALAATVVTWTLLTPPSWYAFGPGLLMSLAGARVDEYSAGQASDGDALFLPSRYFWPFVLAGALILCSFITARWTERRRRPRSENEIEAHAEPRTAAARVGIPADPVNPR